MRILYTIAGLYRPAGMERILTDKANYLATRGHELTIVTTEQQGRPIVFPLEASIKHVDLGIGYEEGNGGSFISKLIRYPAKKLRHKRALARVLRELRPDIVISMFCGDESFLPWLNDGSKKILEVHFSRFKRLQYGRKGLWALADRFRSRSDLRHIRRFDKFVVLTEEDFDYWGRPANGVVIPNFIGSMPQEPSPLEAKTVLSAGRFEYQKGFERLIRAWKIVGDRAGHDGWRLRIVGDGPEREALQALTTELGLGGSVVLDQPHTDMGDVYRQASVFALSSRYEGLPMVLLEAQAYGLPIVAFDCKCGPRDVVTPGQDGLLVAEGDVSALAEALSTLIHDGQMRSGMAAKARENALRWDKEIIMQKWTTLLENI